MAEGGRPPTHDWAALKKTWEDGFVKSAKAFASQNGLSCGALRNRMSLDKKAGNPWSHPKSARLDNVVDLDGRRRTKKRDGNGGGLERKASQNLTKPSGGDAGGMALCSEEQVQALIAGDGDPSADVVRQARLAAGVAEGILLRALRGKVTPGLNQSLADVVDKAVSTLERATKLARLNSGKEAGQPTAEGVDVHDTKWETEYRIVGESTAAAS